ncbi:MAG: TldD/PmbA family protein [Candidatus Aenigmarchaeota archaeon]|nr:TldD/PmbA family protein [Candidatus Aenigmarchaeota archaeon]
MIETAKKILNEAMKRGADQAEVFFTTTKTFGFSSVKDKVKKGYYHQDSGFGLRVVIGKRVGFSYGRNDVDRIVERALKTCKKSKPLEAEFSLPSRTKKGRGVFDESVESLDEKTSMEMVKRTVKSVKDVGSKVIEASFSYAVEERGIVNSEGLENVEKASYFEIGVEARYRSSSFSDFEYSRKFDLNPEKVGENAGKYAKDVERARMLKEDVKKVLFHPNVLSGLLTFTVWPSFYADNVQKHRSLFEGKLGKQVLARNITVIDDGTQKDGWRTYGFDGEGCKMKKKFLARKGVISSFLYDVYTASKDGVDPTGNGMRSEFRSLPRISLTNVMLKNGKKSWEDFLEDRTVYVVSTLGSFLSNPATADFSVKIALAYYLENGKLLPVKGNMLSGNMLVILKRLEEVSKETLVAGSPSDVYTYGVPGQKLPYMATEHVKVSF